MKRFGLIGKHLGHSWSQAWWNDMFRRKGLTGCTYENFELATIEDFRELLSENTDLRGLNVTIPYKESVMSFLDEVDEVARQVGAVNTIAITDGKAKGFNTDAEGFRRSIRPFLAPAHNRALVLGTGGASRAVCHVLSTLGVSSHRVSRDARRGDLSYDGLSPAIFDACKLIVNCTPVGMNGFPDAGPPIDGSHLTSDHFVVDLVYNPPVTPLLSVAKARGAMVLNGSDMLHFQAEAAGRIWGVL